MTDKEISIRMKLIDEVSKKINTIDGRMTQFSRGFKKNWMAASAAVLATTYAVKKFVDAGLAAGGALIETGSTVEQLKVRLEGLLGSVSEGNRLFELMSDFAGEVPKTYEEIMASATDLAAVVRGGTDEVAALMPIIVDIAAGTGMQVSEVSGQMIRMYSAGAAAADMFRERGISAALGFKAGVSYTAEETMNQITEIWESGHGKFVGAAQRLAETYEGAMSMIMDNWFKFKTAVGEPMFEDVKKDLNAVLTLIQESKKEGGEYNEVVKELSAFFQEAYAGGKDLVALLFVSGGQLLDIWNELSWTLKGAQASWAAMMAGIMQGTSWLAKIPGIWKKLVDKEAFEAGIDEAIEEIERLNQEIIAARERADVDYSTRMAEELAKFKEILERKKEEIAGQEEDRKASEVENNQTSFEVFVAAEEKKIEKTRELWAAWRDEKTRAELVALQEEGERYQFYLDTVKKANQSVYVLLGQIKDTSISGLSNAMSQLTKGAFDAKEAAADLGAAFVDVLIKFALQKIVNSAISKTLLAEETAVSVAAGIVVAQAWAAAAANVSLATMGANAAPAAAGITATHALSRALSIPMAAEGAEVLDPGSVMVGERGPEILDLPRGAVVTPLEKSGRGGVSIGNMNIYISFPRRDPNAQEIARVISAEVEDSLRGVVSVT